MLLQGLELPVKGGRASAVHTVISGADLQEDWRIGGDGPSQTLEKMSGTVPVPGSLEDTNGGSVPGSPGKAEGDRRRRPAVGFQWPL